VARSAVRTFVATGLALIAFAANSLLCRMALGSGLIDPTGFTLIRLASGALALLPLPMLLEPRREGRRGGSWPSALALFAYAIGFSWAYVTLDTGTGALVLFGAVQATMIGVGLRRGERPAPGEWIGLVAALAGLAWLVAPGVSAPDPLGLLLMAVAGAAWGLYSLRGRGESQPIGATAGNFLRTIPLAVVAAALAFPTIHAEPRGVALAIVSGAVTSGLGYVVWYVALRDLAVTPAAIVQLPVPVLAAAAGVVFLGEQPTARLAVAAALILGGVACAILTRSRSGQ